MSKKRILYFYVGRSTFVDKDIRILSSVYHVDTFNFDLKAKWRTPFQLIGQFLFLLIKLPFSKGCVCQLAGYHSYLPSFLSRLFGKKSVIIAAGTDCQSFPSIGYGNFQKKGLNTFTRWSFQLCHHISTKHDTLWHCDYTYDDHDFPSQGISYFMPSLKDKHASIVNGYDSEQFRRIAEKKKNSFITVSGGLQYRFQRQLKGIDLILEIAPKFPDCTFTIIGADEKSGIQATSSNVILLPPIPNENLCKYYSESQFYFQLSMAEGFPNALCEAMLCECIPIGSDVFSIPEIISDTGYVLRKRDAAVLEELLNNVLRTASPDGKPARARIVENYSLEKRAKSLLNMAQHIF